MRKGKGEKQKKSKDEEVNGQGGKGVPRVHAGHMLFTLCSSQPISWLSTEETKPNTTKANIHQQHKDTRTR